MELNDQVILSKEFEDRCRGHFEQLMTDIVRLGEQFTDLQRVISETVEFIHSEDLELSSAQAKPKEDKLDNNIIDCSPLPRHQCSRLFTAAQTPIFPMFHLYPDTNILDGSPLPRHQ